MSSENNKMESYNGRKEVYGRVQKMIDESKSTLRIMTTENGIVRMHKVREKSYREAIERGVSLRIALPITSENLYFIREFIKIGAEIRHLPDVARNRFVNMDSCEVMAHFTSQDDREIEAKNDYGVWTKIPEFVELTTKFFDNLWNKLITYQERQIRLKFGILGRLIIATVYLVFIFCFVRWMLVKNMSEEVIAILCGIISTLFWFFGYKSFKLLFRREE